MAWVIDGIDCLPGGIAVDVKMLSEREREKLTRKFVQVLF